MHRYQIEANGTDMGVFEGQSEDEAIAAYVSNAGYSDVATAAEVCGQTVEEFLDEISVTKISE